MEEKPTEAEDLEENARADAHGKWAMDLCTAHTGLQDLVGRLIATLEDGSSRERLFLVGCLLVAEAFFLGVNEPSGTPAYVLAANPPPLRPAGQ